MLQTLFGNSIVRGVVGNSYKLQVQDFANIICFAQEIDLLHLVFKDVLITTLSSYTLLKMLGFISLQSKSISSENKCIKVSSNRRLLIITFPPLIVFISRAILEMQPFSFRTARKCNITDSYGFKYCFI